MFSSRLATSDDLPLMREVAVKALQRNPMQQSLYKGECDGEPYAKRLETAHLGLIYDPNCHCYVAVDKAGKIVGFIAYEKFDGISGGEPASSLGSKSAVYPPSTDMLCVQSWKEEMTNTRETFLKERGPYWRAHMFWVAPDVHKRGVGTMLYKLVGAEADKEGLPIMLGSTTYTNPFYERFAAQNGYALTRLRIADIQTEKGQPQLQIHFLMLKGEAK